MFQVNYVQKRCFTTIYETQITTIKVIRVIKLVVARVPVPATKILKSAVPVVFKI